MYTLNQTEKEICKSIVDSAYAVHHKLGPGLLEKIYEVCFCHELGKRNISFQRQVDVPIYYEFTFYRGSENGCLC